MMERALAGLMIVLALSACSPKWIAFAEEEAERIIEDIEGKSVDPRHHHHKKDTAKEPTPLPKAKKQHKIHTKH